MGSLEIPARRTLVSATLSAPDHLTDDVQTVPGGSPWKLNYLVNFVQDPLLICGRNAAKS